MDTLDNFIDFIVSYIRSIPGMSVGNANASGTVFSVHVVAPVAFEADARANVVRALTDAGLDASQYRLTLLGTQRDGIAVVHAQYRIMLIVGRISLAA